MSEALERTLGSDLGVLVGRGEICAVNKESPLPPEPTQGDGAPLLFRAATPLVLSHVRLAEPMRACMHPALSERSLAAAAP